MRGNQGYRPDIDGLRAVAVIPVVLFHAGIDAFSGGFVGVDVFFVISGYLITTIIAREIEASTFTIAGFYERRIRRIFPALFTVVLCSLAAGYLLFLPADFEELAQSAVAITAFSSNMLFWYKAGYFDGPSEMKPLLHTWSLSVEEQFYVVFPLILLLSLRYLGRRGSAWLIAVAALVSLTGSQLALERWVSAVFYFAPARAWELALGALLALGLIPAAKSALTNLVLGLAGFALIAFSVVAYEPGMSFPGLSALVPCLGAAFLIQAGRSEASSFVSRLLSWTPLVFVGLISYSLYLWHWPVIVFARYVSVGPLSPTHVAAVLIVSVLLAVLSWRYVEQPFRARHHVRERRTVFAIGAAMMAATVVAGLPVALNRGLPSRLPQEVADILAVQRNYNPHRTGCFDRTPLDVREKGLCRIGDAEGDPAFLVWGDSHADMLIPAYHRIANRAETVGLAAAKGRCAALLGVFATGPRAATDCVEFNDEVLALIQRTPSIKNVVLVARWGGYLTGGPPFLVDRDHSGEWGEANLTKSRRGLQRTVAALRNQGITVHIVAPLPAFRSHVPHALARAEWFGRPFSISLTRQAHLEAEHKAFALFENQAKLNQVVVLYPHKLLCHETECLYESFGKLLYRDSNHLSFAGVELVEPALIPAIGRGTSHAGGPASQASDMPLDQRRLGRPATDLGAAATVVQ